MAEKPKITFKVWYKPNPHYDGHHDVCQAEGLHGSFDTIAKARTGAAACKKWFNDERFFVEKPEVNGKVETELKTVVHDNVVVWIEEYRDGFPVEGEISCEGGKEEEAPRKKRKEPRPAELTLS